MALIQPSKFLKIDYGMQGWTRLLDLNFLRLNDVLLRVPQLGDVYAPSGVQDKDILVWDATNNRWVVTRFHDYFPLPTATGDVALDDLILSVDAGDASVDFSEADVLTDYVPYRGKLTITDSSGKKIEGYIKAIDGATGVTITSTPDGSTYDWATQEEGFNYNDASGYTYAIEGMVEP